MSEDAAIVPATRAPLEKLLERDALSEDVVGIVDLYTPLGLRADSPLADKNKVYHNLSSVIESQQVSNAQFAQCNLFVGYARGIFSLPNLLEEYDEYHDDQLIMKKDLPGLDAVTQEIAKGREGIPTEYSQIIKRIERKLEALEYREPSIAQVLQGIVQENTALMAQNPLWLFDKQHRKDQRGLSMIVGLTAAIAYATITAVPAVLFPGYVAGLGSREYLGSRVTLRSVASASAVTAAAIVPIMYSLFTGSRLPIPEVSLLHAILYGTANAGAYVYGTAVSVQREKQKRKRDLLQGLHSRLEELKAASPIIEQVNPGYFSHLKNIAGLLPKKRKAVHVIEENSQQQIESRSATDSDEKEKKRLRDLSKK